jgi:hypothetical protein
VKRRPKSAKALAAAKEAANVKDGFGTAQIVLGAEIVPQFDKFPLLLLLLLLKQQAAETALVRKSAV